MKHKQHKSSLTPARALLHRVHDNTHRIVLGVPKLKYCQITHNIYLGSQYSRGGLHKLQELGITGIINMREHSPYKLAHYRGMHYLHLSTVDNTAPTLEALLKGISFIDTELAAGGKVYLHCRQGLGRGPTMAIAYLIKTGYSYTEAHDMVKAVRTFINPRPCQVERLQELEAYYAKNRKS
jgi:protein-tyrosine phosphatase